MTYMIDHHHLIHSHKIATHTQIRYIYMLRIFKIIKINPPSFFTLNFHKLYKIFDFHVFKQMNRTSFKYDQ